jgi:hypothetical protein
MVTVYLLDGTAVHVADAIKVIDGGSPKDMTEVITLMGLEEKEVGKFRKAQISGYVIPREPFGL